MNKARALLLRIGDDYGVKGLGSERRYQRWKAIAATGFDEFPAVPENPHVVDAHLAGNLAVLQPKERQIGDPLFVQR